MSGRGVLDVTLWRRSERAITITCCPEVAVSRCRDVAMSMSVSVSMFGGEYGMGSRGLCSMRGQVKWLLNTHPRYVLRYLKAVKEMKRIINENQLTV